MKFEEKWEDFEDFWENFGFKIGPYGIGFYGLSQRIRYTRTDKSHLLRIRINPDIKKEEIKARLSKPGLIEIEWPRRKMGEDIPVE
ncbi:MAG TPA: hypothetical protein DEG96_01215 [Candidatus Atribacteria bacterium]|nr:hypothetical protein [Candidatus Atribacteria bacterium]